MQEQFTPHQLFELRCALNESTSYWHDIYIRVLNGSATHVTLEGTKLVMDNRQKLLEHIETLMDKL
jgi:hypothetical protein